MDFYLSNIIKNIPSFILKILIRLLMERFILIFHSVIFYLINFVDRNWILFAISQDSICSSYCLRSSVYLK